MPDDIAAFAISPGCSGFVYGLYLDLQTFGGLSDTIIIRRGAYRENHIVENNSLDVSENFAFMNGYGVMNFSAKYVPKNPADLLHFAKADVSEAGAFLLHLILSEMKRLNEPENFLFLMSGFGVGMSIASALIDLTDILCLLTEKLQEVKIHEVFCMRRRDEGVFCEEIRSAISSRP